MNPKKLEKLPLLDLFVYIYATDERKMQEKSLKREGFIW